MTKIAIITSTGNAQADSIFKGVFGSIGATGQFEVSPELKRIHLFTLLTPEALAAQKIDLSSSYVEVDIAPEHAAAMKATLTSNLSADWDKTYGATLAKLDGGLARAAVEAERASVAKAVAEMLAEYAVPLQVVSLEAVFENVSSQLNYNYDGDDDGVVNGANTSASIIAHASGNNWTPALQQSVLTELQQVSQTANADTTFVSGVLVNEITIHAEGEEQGNTVLAAVLALPEVLRDSVIHPENARILQIEWHAYHPFETNTAGANVETASTQLQAPVDFEASYQELLAFKEAHGHSDQQAVPDRSELFAWVQTHRQNQQNEISDVDVAGVQAPRG
jgi:Helicase associated domain